MLSQQSMDALKQIAKGIALQFGPNCEVVIHEISDKSAYSSIVAIENGHVTGRKVGDGPSHVVLEQLGHEDDSVRDQFGYLTRTKDGKILKSTSVYIRDETGRVAAILGINYDISMMQMLDSALHAFITPDQPEPKEPERITLNVADLLDDLIRQADEQVGHVERDALWLLLLGLIGRDESVQRAVEHLHHRNIVIDAEDRGYAARFVPDVDGRGF